ncbi:MAG: acetolactate synthase [Clostridiales bacterium 43-6]|nr:MAG: acetolactate synthase [Clostridiales bacterium 43-6]
MKISDYIVSFLADKGITDVFGYPGGMVTHLMDSFNKQNRITAHVNYHEQGAAFCACGYAQASLRPGVAYATSGPGATNLITGIANAYFDSIPCIFITGQVNTYESKGGLSVRQKGFQETEIIGIVQSVTKYAVQVTKPEEIRYELEKAFCICASGRPGPVLLDIPMNIQRQDIEPEELHSYEPEPKKEKPFHLADILTELKSAKRPCMIVGAGVKISGMQKQLRKLSDRLGIPVVSSMIAVDVLPGSYENYYGFIGAYGERRANFIVAKSDLILSLGSRLDCRQVGTVKENFAPDAKLIRVDIDADEMTNIIKPDELQIAADLRTVIPWLIENTEESLKGQYSDWIHVCNDITDRLLNIDQEASNGIVKELSKIIPENTVITTDVGQNQVWLAQSFDIKDNQEMFFSGGHGAMGYSLPAAIGAYYGSGKTVVSFNGDGGVQMNIQELQFIAREKIPVKVVILNNHSLGMIRHFQEMYFDSIYTQTVTDNGYTVPSFQKIAAAYDLPYYCISENIPSDDKIFSEDGPAVIEVMLPHETYVFPKLAMNKPNQDQEPAIDREIYDYLMNL